MAAIPHGKGLFLIARASRIYQDAPLADLLSSARARAGFIYAYAEAREKFNTSCPLIRNF